MATLTDHSLSPPLFFGDDDDEDIIEVGSIRTTGGRQPSLAEILHPSASRSRATGQQRTLPHGSRAGVSRPRHHRVNLSRRSPENRRLRQSENLAQTAFIDLTGEDSPAVARSSTSHHPEGGPLPLPLPLPHSQPAQESQSQSQTQISQSSLARHPRRTNSQRISPPSLERSDSHTFMASRGNFIDLTEESPDSPESERHHAARRSEQSTGQFPETGHRRRTGRASQTEPSRDELWGLNLRSSGWVEPFRSLRDFLGNATGFQPPRLDVSRNPFNMNGHHNHNHHHHHHHPHSHRHQHGFAADLQIFAQHGIPIPAGIVREPSPKPPMEPIPEATAGFTRDTYALPEEEEEQGNGSEERVVICPACREELAYDPMDSAAAEASSPATKKRKRAPGEHHFWALKKCGHVYCADCFENRKPSKTKPFGAGFHTVSGVAAEHGAPGASDVRCAVDGCDTKALNKGEWLGIFL